LRSRTAATDGACRSRRDSVSSFFLFDGLQNVCQLTDDSETVTDEYAYSADGRPISTTGTTANSQTYKGQRLAYHRDLDLGPEVQYATHYRNIDPQTNRFSSEDPAEDDRNTYRVVENNPLNYEDPSGLQQLLGLDGILSRLQKEKRAAVSAYDRQKDSITFLERESAVLGFMFTPDGPNTMGFSTYTEPARTEYRRILQQASQYGPKYSRFVGKKNTRETRRALRDVINEEYQQTVASAETGLTEIHRLQDEIEETRELIQWRDNPADAGGQNYTNGNEADDSSSGTSTVRRRKFGDTMEIYEEGKKGEVRIYETNDPGLFVGSLTLLFGGEYYQKSDRPIVVIGYDTRNPDDRDLALEMGHKLRLVRSLNEFKNAAASGIVAAPQDALSTIYPIVEFFGGAADSVAADQ
jgi:RHS repeat-associated protein